ncbi:MAG: Uma2 family endonuclease [Isosphaeraceae bacterium]
MASAAVIPRITAEQYLALERKAQFKSEYCNGFIIAMAGATKQHNTITLNLAAEIRSQLKGRRCAVYLTDMRVRVSATGLYTYPDVVAACGESQFEDDESDTLLNPTMIAEVLSKTTEAYDRGDKFAQYRQLISLREYVLISQDKVLVERFTRRENEWVLTEFRSLDDILPLESIGCQIALREIYALIEFSGKAAAGA